MRKINSKERVYEYIKDKIMASSKELQDELMLCKTTVSTALRSLKKDDLITDHIPLYDTRKKLYKVKRHE
jgi:DNA-binding MarR family transcriptional regulator